jgi:hypothetical protein
MRRKCVLFGIVLALVLAGTPGVASAAGLGPTPVLSHARVPAGVPGAALVGEPAVSPTPAHAPLPASLVALEQKMEELKVTSMRFSARSSITVPHAAGKLLHVLKLLGNSGISGEEMISPPSGNFTLSLFGHPFKVRVVDGATYLYLSGLDRHHRRHHLWIKLGPGGLLEVFTVNGKHVKTPKAAPPKEPALAEPSFVGLRKMLAGAQEVRELAAGTLDGQPVTNFLAVLEPAQIEHEALASISRLRPPPQPPVVTLETSLAQDGLPLRTVITERSAKTVLSTTLSIPAINFPVVVQAPPPSQTITVARLRKLERRSRRRRHSQHK